MFQGSSVVGNAPGYGAGSKFPYVARNAAERSRAGEHWSRELRILSVAKNALTSFTEDPMRLNLEAAKDISVGPIGLPNAEKQDAEIKTFVAFAASRSKKERL